MLWNITISAGHAGSPAQSASVGVISLCQYASPSGVTGFVSRAPSLISLSLTAVFGGCAVKFCSIY
eukprot:942892-Rhodomonas_salina.1